MHGMPNINAAESIYLCRTVNAIHRPWIIFNTHEDASNCALDQPSRS